MTRASDDNREFYDRSLPGRDDYWRKMAAPRARVRTILEMVRRHAPSSLLDLGSGGGQLLAEVHARFPHVRLAGADLAEAQIAANARSQPHVSWHTLDLDAGVAVPEALRGAFDLVVATELIEHLDHPGRMLASAYEMAHPGSGRLVLSTQSGPVRETERRVGHRRHFSRDEMRAALTAAGWVPERVWNAGFPFHDLSKWYANLDPEGSMDRFAERAYGVRENLVCLGLRAAFLLNSRRHGGQLFAVARRAGG